MAGSGTTALASDVNDPLGTGASLMGTGSASRGYGQTTFGTGVSTSTTIAASDYDSIRYNLLNASAHQNGSAAALSLAGNVAGQLINSTDATTFSSYASTVDAARFTCHSTRKSTTAYGGNSRTTSWTSAAVANYTLFFASGDAARYFWNGGGAIRITSSRTGGAATAQNTAWSSLLSSAGTQEFGGASVYTWGTSLTTLYSAYSSAPYSSNQYTIEVSLDAPIGSATQFTFKLGYRDPYVDPAPGHPPLPEDIVDGTLSYSVDLVYPTGGHSLTPSGTWTSYAPTSYGAGAYSAF
jgi:hypothetical protein